MEDDEKYDYSSAQTPPVREEISVYTSSSEFTPNAPPDLGDSDLDDTEDQ